MSCQFSFKSMIIEKMQLIILLLLIVFITDSLARDIDYCFVNERDPYLWFGTKTPYRFVSNGKIEAPKIPNCKPIQIWMMARHATRYPQEAAVHRLKELPKIRDEIIISHEKKGMGHLCNEDLRKLKEWTLGENSSERHARTLAAEGWREGNGLGKRLRDAYPDLLQPSPQDMNSKNYVFRSIKGARSESSMLALMEGMLGNKSAVEPLPSPKPDVILQPDRNCLRWSTEKPADDEIRDAFINGPVYAEMRRNVSERLGFNVSPRTIHNMQDMCRFETAWSPNKLSPWCAVFSKHEWKILEYIDDLQYYYSAGYGYKINSLLGCFPMKDLFHNFRNIESGKTNGKPKGIFYFSTSRILLDFLNAMGIARDSKLLSANNFNEMDNRKWRTSFLAPFFANFIATFHRCNDTITPNKVTFHLEEELVIYDGCPGGICDWEYLKGKFEKFTEQCNKNCEVKPFFLFSTNSIDLALLMSMLFMLALSSRPMMTYAFYKMNRYSLLRISFKNSRGNILKY